MSKIKVLLVDDHAVVRMGFKMLINAEPDMVLLVRLSQGSQA